MATKLTIIGAGAVGAAAAQWAVSRNSADEIVLIDVVEGVAEGKALDLCQAAPICGFNGKVWGSSDFKDCADSDVIIITAGLARKPGMTRDDLLAKNVQIVKSVTENCIKHAPSACFVVVTNPIDAMVYTVFKVSGFARNKVVGMAGVLDSARYRTLIAKELGISPSDVSALVMGIHGDNMLPLTRLATAGGVPVENLIPKARLDEIITKTQHGGGEIVALLKTGSAFSTPGISAVEMAESILKDQKKIMPCAAYLEGEYEISGVFLGVPVVLGKNGVEKIIEFELAEAERQALGLSVDAVKKQVSATGL